MDKRLEIAGTGKVWIVKKCIECHLLDSDAMCVIDNKHRPKFCEECENCPLPDATEAPADVWPDDENHRLGPNGERLIAVNSYDMCDSCFGVTRLSHTMLEHTAFCGDHKKPCSANLRQDRRYIKWVISGDRK